MSLVTEIRNGVWPVMLTPFTPSSVVDWDALDELVDYYIHEGVAGLYPVATSGEMFDLTTEEILSITRRVVARSNGRINVVATGNFGCTLEDQEEMIRRVQETGVDAVIIATSFLPSDRRVIASVLELASRLEGPLGLYETPLPTHTLIEPSDLAEIAASGRFVFLKETSREVPIFHQKVDLVDGTPLKVFQGNLNGLLNSGDNTGNGFAGCVANVIPRAVNSFLSLRDAEESWVENAPVAIRTVEKVIMNTRYPASAKYFLSKLGLRISHHCRWDVARQFCMQDMEQIDAFIGAIEPWLSAGPGDWRYFDMTAPGDLHTVIAQWKDLAAGRVLD